MIRVCDAIMGTGKTEASIAYMNERPEERFIYITPFLDEAKRIRESCPELNFVEPSANIEEFNFKKTEHTAHLIHLGKNIATTHQAFKRYTAEMLEDIRRWGYSLIIDEDMDVLEEYDVHPDDVDMAIRAGYVDERDNSYRLVDDSYSGRALHEMFEFLKVRELICMQGDQKTYLYYWVLPADLITAFKEVTILTYLFEGQSLHHFMEINQLPYQMIGVRRMEGGGYRFCDYPGDVPEYTKHLKDMINIIDLPKLNAVGDSRTSLSKTWFENDGEGVRQLRMNVDNCVRNIWKDTPGSKKLWGTFKKQYSSMKGKGYTKSFLPFNAKSTNEYRDRNCLIYIANIFMNVDMKRFYVQNGIEVDEDLYALSIMVQWIWRSAIRDGQKINLYIPSKRMRDLLTNWIDRVVEGSENVVESE